MLKKLTIVVDANLWGDAWEEQMNCIEQGLMNARGKDTDYPIEWSDYIYPKKRTGDDKFSDVNGLVEKLNEMEYMNDVLTKHQIIELLGLLPKKRRSDDDE